MTEKFANIDLHPDAVSNAQMGAVFEELIRRFAEISNETAREHFTPRAVIRLFVNLLFIADNEALTKGRLIVKSNLPRARTKRRTAPCVARQTPVSPFTKRPAKPCLTCRRTTTRRPLPYRMCYHRLTESTETCNERR